MSGNRVRVTIEMDNTFLGILKSEVDSGQLYEKGELSPQQQLALFVAAEAMGETELVVIPAWWPHLDVVGAERRVYSPSEEQIYGPYLSVSGFADVERSEEERAAT